MSAYFHSYLCGRKAAEWLIDMELVKKVSAVAGVMLLIVILCVVAMYLL